MIKLEKVLKIGDKIFEVYSKGFNQIEAFMKDDTLNKHYCPLIDVETKEIYDYIQIGEKYYYGIFEYPYLDPDIKWESKDDIKKEKICKDFKNYDEDMVVITYKDIKIEGFKDLIKGKTIKENRIEIYLRFLERIGSKEYKNLYLGITDEVDGNGRTKDRLIMEKKDGYLNEIPFIAYVCAVENKPLKEIDVNIYNENKNKFKDNFRDLEEMKNLKLKTNKNIAYKDFIERNRIFYEILNNNKTFVRPWETRDGDICQLAIYYDKEENKIIYKDNEGEKIIDVHTLELLVRVDVDYRLI